MLKKVYTPRYADIYIITQYPYNSDIGEGTCSPLSVYNCNHSMVYKGHQILSSDVINSSELNILQGAVFLSDSVRNCGCGESIKDSQDFVTSVTLLQERDEQFRRHVSVSEFDMWTV
tara:strand:- start:799 stop:1149 length:351 start_codon:yes stop_codon:yes gene_type:complete